MNDLELVIVTKDDHGQSVDPPRLLLNDKLYQPEPDSNGWRYRIEDVVTITIHWCEINGVPGNDCPDHERHHRREHELPTGRCGDRTLLALTEDA